MCSSSFVSSNRLFICFYGDPMLVSYSAYERVAFIAINTAAESLGYTITISLVRLFCSPESSIFSVLCLPRRRRLPQATAAGDCRRRLPQATAAGDCRRRLPQATTAVKLATPHRLICLQCGSAFTCILYQINLQQYGYNIPHCKLKCFCFDLDAISNFMTISES